MTIIKLGLTVSISVILSTLITYAFFAKKFEVYTVDLGRITTTQMLVAGRLASSGVNKATWMTTIKDTSANVRKTIQQIAGSHTVIVSPAVIQGSVDITDQVLSKLGLPINLPRIDLSQSDVMPSLIPKVANPVNGLPTKKEESSWLLP